MGYTDTFERVENWLTRRIQLEDEYLGYVSTTSSVQKVDNQDDDRSLAYYSVTGIKMKNLSSGISIVKKNDGTVRKVIKQ